MLWKSRKFRILIYDTIVSVVATLAAWFLAPEYVEKVMTLIGILQPAVLFLIAGIAYEDGQSKRAGK